MSHCSTLGEHGIALEQESRPAKATDQTALPFLIAQSTPSLSAAVSDEVESINLVLGCIRPEVSAPLTELHLHTVPPLAIGFLKNSTKQDPTDKH